MSAANAPRRPPPLIVTERPERAAPPDSGLTRGGLWLLTLFSLLYLANPGWGFAEFIPDVVPFVGNIDEASATAALIWAVRRLRKGSRST